jgi:malate permease and related proteins
MTDALFHAYASLFIWIGVGLVLYRFLPDTVPRLLGRGLFWVGMPVEIFDLARRTDFSRLFWLAPVATVTVLMFGLSVALSVLQVNQHWPLTWLGLRGKQPFSLYPDKSPSLVSEDSTLELTSAQKGSFVLSATLGNTGFVGLAIAATILSPENMGIAAFYTVMHNIFGLYGVGVIVSHHFGQASAESRWWTSLLAVIKVPTVWAFILGVSTQFIKFPQFVETSLDQSVWIVIPCGFLLTGLRLSQLKNWESLVSGVIPAVVKMLIMPAVVLLITPLLGIIGEPRLALVLMAGTPTALTTLVLAEEYNLDRDLIASSIALSMLVLIPLVPLWLKLLT